MRDLITGGGRPSPKPVRRRKLPPMLKSGNPLAVRAEPAHGMITQSMPAHFTGWTPEQEAMAAREASHHSPRSVSGLVDMATGVNPRHPLSHGSVNLGLGLASILPPVRGARFLRAASSALRSGPRVNADLVNIAARGGLKPVAFRSGPRTNADLARLAQLPSAAEQMYMRMAERDRNQKILAALLALGGVGTIGGMEVHRHHGQFNYQSPEPGRSDGTMGNQAYGRWLYGR